MNERGKKKTRTEKNQDGGFYDQWYSASVNNNIKNVSIYYMYIMMNVNARNVCKIRFGTQVRKKERREMKKYICSDFHHAISILKHKPAPENKNKIY